MKMRYYKIVVILLLLNTSNFYSQNYFELGSKEFDNSNYLKALDLFTSSIENKTDIAKSYLYRGATNLFLNKVENAKTDLDESFKLDKSDAKLFYYFGKYYFLIKDYKSSIDNYDIAISKDSKYALAYSARGAIKCLSGNCETGMKDLDDAIRLEPKNYLLYITKGYTKLKLGKYEESVTDFETSLKIKPSQKANANMGVAYLNLKMFSLAIVYFTKSLDFNANDPEILFYRGQTYDYLGDYENACSDYSKSNSLVTNEASLTALKRLKCK